MTARTASKPDTTHTIAEEIKARVCARLGEIACNSVDEGRSADAFVVFAIQIDPGTRWRDLARRICDEEQLEDIESEGSPSFLYGDMDIEVFLDLVSGMGEEFKLEALSDRERCDVRGVIIMQDDYYFVDFAFKQTLQ